MSKRKTKPISESKAYQLHRQGDVMLKRIDSIPSGFKEIKHDGRVVLAEGEVTGHAHVAKDRLARLFGDENGNRCIELSDQAVLEHEEHSAHRPVGRFEIVHQREYSPQEIRRVAD